MRFVGSNASSHSMKLRDILLSAVTVLLYHLQKMSTFSSHMRQNAYYRNLIELNLGRFAAIFIVTQ